MSRRLPRTTERLQMTTHAKMTPGDYNYPFVACTARQAHDPEALWSLRARVNSVRTTGIGSFATGIGSFAAAIESADARSPILHRDR
jgi:hypothetical protein